MIDEPSPPLGNPSLAVFIRNLMRWIRRYVVLDIVGAKRKPQAGGGVIYEIQFPSQPPGGSAGGINFRGEYDPALAYAKNDLVVVSYGPNMGTYLCVTDNPGADNPPNQGNNFWVSFFPSLGQFM